MKITKEIHIRNIAVYGHYSQRQFTRSCFVPQIRLCGKWLRDAGFEAGDPIKIVITKKCLLILPNEDIQEEQ